ncbi:hypothetical protein O3G_MSEX001254 [Manduca sexta]|uniref:Hemolin n=2 Tax=Manduca sexta TaxID=7130 RepID=A0A921YJR6_MANSE|nr:hypothetical protein O3G_MSEX001254 [Manduca sexta]
MLPRFLAILIFVHSVLYASCARTKSLTFVIDDTKSMRDDINQVLKEVDGIMNSVLNKASEIEDLVLVTFNDPDVHVRKKTRSRKEFERALSSIKVNNYNNYDCPEYSLSGIEMALFESKPGSYIYVFTDASAKDYKKADKIKDLCQKTQSKVVFVLTGNCRRPESVKYQVYHEVAIASSGLVLEVEKNEVNLVVKTIHTFVEGNTNPVKSVTIPANKKFVELPFSVDDKTDNIIISGTGKNIILLVDSIGEEILMSTKNSKMLQLNKPAPGNYTIKVKASSTSHVVVYARTNFTFQHGFSQTQPKTINDTSRKPLANMQNRLSILIEDPNDSVEIETAQLMNLEDETPIGKPLQLKQIEDNLYITQPFISPEFPFKLAVNGHYVDNNRPVRSFAKTPIYPNIVDIAVKKKPTVTISEGVSTTVIMGSELILTCKVHAYPNPEIIWIDENGNTLRSKTSCVEKPYDFISYLNLTRVEKAKKYACAARNRLGHDKKQIDVKIGDPFKVISYPGENTRAKYAESTSLKCRISSDFKMKITWYYNGGYGAKKLHSNDIYNISSDGTELVIKSLKKDLAGKYTCVASLLSDRHIRKIFTTNLEVYGYDPPIISKLVSFLRAQESEAVTIPCVLSQGVPKPTIQWQYRTKGSFVDVDVKADARLRVSNDGLHISKSQLLDNGEYKCIAQNDAGIDEHIATLTINKEPEINIIEGTEIKIDYGSEVQIECKVTGNPLPKIEWREENGDIVAPKSLDDPIRHQYHQSSILILKNQKRSKKMYCCSENAEGKDMKAIDIIVGPAFHVISHPEGVTNVNYNEEANIICDVRSNMPMEITWFYTNDKTGEKTKITPSSKYSMLLNGTVLKIHSMDLDLVGKYTCNASLTLDENQHRSFDTLLRIQGLKKPKLAEGPHLLKMVRADSKVTLECRVLEGHPKPTISWEFRSRGSDVFLPTNATGNQLEITIAILNNSGHYRCKAQNVLGQDTKTIELEVSMVPAAIIFEGKQMNLSYRAEAMLSCAVTAFPPPKIIWTDSKGMILDKKMPPESVNHMYQSDIVVRNMTKSEKFSCHASNDLGDNLETIDVNVAAPFEVEEKPEADVKVEYGKAHVVKCHIKSALNMTIQWYRIPETKGVARLIKSSEIYSISSEGRELTIAFMEPNLDGTYRCTASLTDNVDEKISFNTKIKTTGLASPVLDKDISNMKVIAGSNVTLFCRIKFGNPTPDIKWIFMSRPDAIRPIYISYTATGQELHISNVSLDDAGRYFCKAQNFVGKDQHEIELIVEAPPVITRSDVKAYTAIVGDVVLKIPCEATGYPKPAISWQVDGTDITPDSKYNIVEGALLVRSPVENDTLEYTCKAMNNVDEDSVILDGIVTDSIYEYENVRNIYIKKGSSEKISCNLTHTKTDTLRWFLNEYVTSQTGPYIYLENATEANDGNYSCRISNENGYSMNTFVVDVGYSPTFTSYQDDIIDWKGDTSLDCAASAKPEAMTHWYFEGKHIRTNESLEQLPITKWGQYICNVANVHGSVNRSFIVTSTDCLIDREVNNELTPLLVTENLKWPIFEAKKKFLVIPHLEKLVLSCQSQDNPSNSFTIMPDKTTIEATCAGKDTFSIGGEIYKYSDLHCSGKILPVVKKTGDQCLNDGTEMVQVGYEVDEFIELYSVCMDTKNKVPLYTKMSMFDMNNINTSTAYKWFNHSDDSYFNNEVYSCESPASCCVAKEQLVNVNDVIFGPAQRSTFIDGLNSIPVWENCNNSRMSWRQLEERIRVLYDTTSQFGVWTGASDYVDTDKGKIPQYLWKVVRLHELYSVAIIYVNDPNPNDSQILCKNVCEEHSWVESYDKYTYCCELTDFLKAFNVTEEAIGGI